MMRPVTSTSVATKGADDVAGSNPSRRKMKGKHDPTKEPHSTTPIKDKATVDATSSQCGPYRFENDDQIEIRRKPIAPRMQPRANPESSSRRMTRKRSVNFSSPSASARITSVDACDPEFPPLEIISG